jgi:hypothetical protein
MVVGIPFRFAILFTVLLLVNGLTRVIKCKWSIFQQKNFISKRQTRLQLSIRIT